MTLGNYLVRQEKMEIVYIDIGFHKITLNLVETDIILQQLTERKPQNSCST